MPQHSRLRAVETTPTPRSSSESPLLSEPLASIITHGVQVPRLSKIPVWNQTLLPRYLTGMQGLSLTPYPWQKGLLRHLTALDPHNPNMWAASSFGLSVPRQSGKTMVIGTKVFLDAMFLPDQLIVWTAHRFKVAREAFRFMQKLTRVHGMEKHISQKNVHTAAGNESLEFNNGSRILFAARERGAIRGFAKIDRLILDEAQILSEDALADLMPTMNASPNPQMLMLGTPPRPVDNGEAFRNFRSASLGSTENGVLYLEWSAPEGCDINEKSNWAIANPSMGYGTSLAAVQRLRNNLPNDEDFSREALGMWDEEISGSIIGTKLWGSLVGEPMVEPFIGEIAVGVDVSPDRSRSSVVVATLKRVNGQKKVHVEIAKSLPGVDWTIPFLKALVKRRNVRALCIDTAGPAGALIEPLIAEGVVVTKLTLQHMVQATGFVYDRIHSGEFEHVGDPQMSAAVQGAGKRVVGDAWLWSRRGSTDITPVVAMTSASYGLIMSSPAEKKKDRTKTSTTWWNY